ncbi:MAG: tRNA (guanosine(46)-N7)-methyltransferase TrmB [Spirochaetales bacterium]|nr:MAG: tRNA (guanosine(46)-N7)-methyltransferase TrmB [Spirochaetales bacterium]
MEHDQYRDQDHIKSYVTRASRMSPSQRRAYDEYRETFCVPFCPGKQELGALFPDSTRPLILEIGFGMGDATAELAAAMPATNFLGVEVHKPGVGKLLGMISERGLTNIRIINHDAMEVLEQMIPSGSLDGIHLFFPDPWQKARHHKRRFVRPGITRILADRLRIDGYFYMVTDWGEYAVSALETLSQTPGLTNSHEAFASPQPWRPTTAFERKGMAAERPIREILFRRGVVT